jgi:hypothetical protein
VQPHIQFYFIPNKKLAILWSPKCACGAIGNWAKAAIQEFEDFTIDADPHFGADARFNLNRRGYNFNLYNLKALIKTGNVNIVAISVRDPISRMHSAFINKFLIHQGNVLQKFSNLELFAKDFIKLASQKSQKGQRKPIKLRKRNDTFNISLAEFIKAIITEKEIRLIDGHFKPQLLEQAHLETITEIKDSISILPLRTENLADDLNILNSKVGFSYLPKKDNVSEIPPGWEATDSYDSATMNNSDLIKQCMMPTRKALGQWLEENPEVLERFRIRFKYDYELMDYLSGS